MKYRKKPVEIEARQLIGSNAETHVVYQWIEDNTQGSFDPQADDIPAPGVSIDPATGFLLIATLEGLMQAKPGDWIIQGVQGEFYPCKPDIFEATYEPATEDTEDYPDRVALAVIRLEQFVAEGFDEPVLNVKSDDRAGDEVPLIQALGMLELAKDTLLRSAMGEIE